MVRTRTIKEAALYFRETDPQTCLTKTAIRTLLRTGAVPSIRVGKKYLVAVEVLEAYLAGDIRAVITFEKKARKSAVRMV